MRYLGLLLILGLVISISQSACTQNNQSNLQSNSNLIFKSNERADGNAFYALDNKTGQLYFMLDYGENRGNWTQYGDIIKSSGTNNLQFDVVERAGATSFYAIDGVSGQLYFTNDDQATGGKWNKYGDNIRENGVNMLQFDATGRFEGNSFYAFDSMSGLMYFMNDFGDEAGQWASYGSALNK